MNQSKTDRRRVLLQTHQDFYFLFVTKDAVTLGKVAVPANLPDWILSQFAEPYYKFHNGGEYGDIAINCRLGTSVSSLRNFAGTKILEAEPLLSLSPPVKFSQRLDNGLKNGTFDLEGGFCYLVCIAIVQCGLVQC